MATRQHSVMSTSRATRGLALGTTHGIVAWYAGISPAYSHLTTDTHGVFWEETQRGLRVTAN